MWKPKLIQNRPIFQSSLDALRPNGFLWTSMKKRFTKINTLTAIKGDKQQQFIELRACGASYQDIADMLHCDKSTLVGWNKELADEIAERKAMTKNDILYNYQVARDNRLRYFSELYRKLKNEIERRGLRDVPTDKLYAMFEKCSKHIDELSGEKREDRKDASIIAISQTEHVKTALKCVRTA